MSWFVLSLVLSIGPALYAGYLALRYRQDRDYWYGRCQWWHDHAGRLRREVSRTYREMERDLPNEPENDDRAARLLIVELGGTLTMRDPEETA